MRKIALIIPALLALGAGAYYIQVLGSENTLIDMYPDYDPNLVIKVHREFVKETLQGKYEGIELTDEKCEEIFKQKLANYTS